MPSLENLVAPTLTTHTNHHSLWNHSNPLKKQKATVAQQQHKINPPDPNRSPCTTDRVQQIPSILANQTY